LASRSFFLSFLLLPLPLCLCLVFALSRTTYHPTTPSFPPSSLPPSLPLIYQAFFALPLSEKEKLSASHNQINRGYTAFEEETLDPALQQGKGDTKEGFYIGREVPAESEEAQTFPLHGPNVWPNAEGLPGWRGGGREGGREGGRDAGRGDMRADAKSRHLRFLIPPVLPFL